MASPHVTRAVGSTTAAGTAQPLTCGRPRQTGRRSAMSGIRSVSAGFVGTSSPAEADRGHRRGRAVLRVNPESGRVGADHRCGSWFANGASVLASIRCTHQDGGVAGASPAEGGVPAISAPARGKAFPHEIVPARETCCCGGEQCVEVYRWQP